MKRAATKTPRASARRRHQRAPEPVEVHPGALRRVLALAEGRRPVHRRPPRRGRLPDRRGARPPRQHLELDRRALLPGARLRGLPRAAGRRARGIPARATPRRAAGGRRAPPTPLFSLDQNEFEAALAADHLNVEETARKVSPQRRWRRSIDAIVGRREGARRGHRPDGLLRQLPAPPADAARPARRGRREPLPGGAQPPRADRRRARS